jgi:maleylpyruvate isomerase
MPLSHDLPHLTETVAATTRYLEALTVLDDETMRGPSLLPGWSRGHVVTHVARNADALTHALHGVLRGEDAWMYTSQQSRDADVAAGADRTAAELREDASASWGRLLQVVNELHPAHLDAHFTRTPGSPGLPVRGVMAARRTEVEVHHADLDIGYGPADWPDDFSTMLVGRVQDDMVAGPSMVLSATDVTATWKFGQGAGPEISGPVAELAWWLVGRGSGSGLVSSSGELPRLGTWR